MFVSLLLKSKAGAAKEDIARQLQWRFPEGLRPIVVYWLEASDPRIIAVAETENVAPIQKTLAEWGAAFDITVVPVMTVEQGLQMARGMIAGNRRGMLARTNLASAKVGMQWFGWVNDVNGTDSRKPAAVWRPGRSTPAI